MSNMLKSTKMHSDQASKAAYMAED